MFERTSATSTESIHKNQKTYVRRRSKSSDRNEKDFENMIDKNLPTWNAVWNFLLQNNNNENEKNRKNKVATKTFARRYKSFESQDENESLQKKIQNKIAELVREEEILVKLYLKAADFARQREEELKDKTTLLLGQIEKDKRLMKTIQNTC